VIDRSRRYVAECVRRGCRGVASSRTLRKVAFGVAGLSVLAVGVGMIFLPGPAVVVIPLGLAILAREFPWAKALLDWLKRMVVRAVARLRHAFGAARRLAGGWWRGGPTEDRRRHASPGDNRQSSPAR